MLGQLGAMSALGHERTFRSAKRHVRFTPESRHVQCKTACPLSAKSGHEGLAGTLFRRMQEREAEQP